MHLTRENIARWELTRCLHDFGQLHDTFTLCAISSIHEKIT